jgi:cell division protein FtsB
MNYQLKKILKSKTLTVVVVVLVLLVALAIYKDYKRQQDLSDEINKQELAIDKLEQERLQLSEVIEILESADYIEREARLRLGLVKPGEKVISVPESARPAISAASTTAGLSQPEKSNPANWFEYFFGGE